MDKTFTGKWICPLDFADHLPRNMYHKEHSPALFALEENDPHKKSQPHHIHLIFVYKQLPYGQRP